MRHQGHGEYRGERITSGGEPRTIYLRLTPDAGAFPSWFFRRWGTDWGKLAYLLGSPNESCATRSLGGYYPWITLGQGNRSDSQMEIWPRTERERLRLAILLTVLWIIGVGVLVAVEFWVRPGRRVEWGRVAVWTLAPTAAPWITVSIIRHTPLGWRRLGLVLTVLWSLLVLAVVVKEGTAGYDENQVFWSWRSPSGENLTGGYTFQGVISFPLVVAQNNAVGRLRGERFILTLLLPIVGGWLVGWSVRWVAQGFQEVRKGRGRLSDE